MTTREYRGHMIALTGDFRWSVTGPLAQDRDAFKSMEEATEAVDRWHDAKEKQDRASAALHIPALDPKGNLVHVKGLHAGHGDLLFAEPKTQIGAIYPNVEWVKLALGLRAHYRTEIEALDEKLDPLAIRTKLAHGRLRPDRYDLLVETFRKQFAQKTERAQKEGGA